MEKPLASYESYRGTVLIYFLHLFLEEHDLGVVLDAKGYLRPFPGRVRIPDVCLISWQRMPNQECPDEALWSLAPDLAVELLGPENTQAEMNQKLCPFTTSDRGE